MDTDSVKDDSEMDELVCDMKSAKLSKHMDTKKRPAYTLYNPPIPFQSIPSWNRLVDSLTGMDRIHAEMMLDAMMKETYNLQNRIEFCRKRDVTTTVPFIDEIEAWMRKIPREFCMDIVPRVCQREYDWFHTHIDEMGTEPGLWLDVRGGFVLCAYANPYSLVYPLFGFGAKCLNTVESLETCTKTKLKLVSSSPVYHKSSKGAASFWKVLL